MTAADVLDQANAGSLDFTLEKKTVLLDEPIKQVGAVQVPIRLHPEVELEITVDVSAEEG